jgi:hypothetical protein
MYPKDSLARLIAMAASGVLDLAMVQIRSFPLKDAAGAHAAVEAGTKLGTVVVLCRAEGSVH